MLERRVLHRLAQVGVHAPRRREDALDARRRGGRGEELLDPPRHVTSYSSQQLTALIGLTAAQISVTVTSGYKDFRNWSF